MARWWVAGAAACLAAACSSSSPPRPPVSIGVPLSTVPAGDFTLRFDTHQKIVTLDLRLFGLVPEARYLVQLHDGICLSNTGAATATFPEITANGLGVVQSSIASRTPSLPKSARIDLHRAHDPAPTPIACSDLTSASIGTTEALFPAPGHKPYGQATLIFQPTDHLLTLRVVADALDPSTTETAEVRRGSCQALGPVIYQLRGFDVGDDRHADVTTELRNVTVGPPAAGWYVSVSKGPPVRTIGPAAPPEPVLCGDVGVSPPP